MATGAAVAADMAKDMFSAKTAESAKAAANQAAADMKKMAEEARKKMNLGNLNMGSLWGMGGSTGSGKPPPPQ